MTVQSEADHGSSITAGPPVIGWGAMFAGGNAVRSLTLAGGVALHAVNVYIATTILPSVVRDIGGIDLYAWNTSLFVVASILGSALSARALRRLGPRRAYLVAAVIFIVGSGLCGAAPSMWSMLGGRFVQGLGGGLMFALAYAMIRLVFPETLWPRAMALVSGMWGIATLIGAAVGGIFAEFDAWRAAFGVLIPATAIFAVMAHAVLPKTSDDDDERSELPVAQLVLLVGAVVAVSAGSVSSAMLWNAIGVVVALGLTVLLVGIERNAKRRLLPRGAFDLGRGLGPLYAVMSLLAVTVTSSEVFVPLFLQVLHRQTPLTAGYLAALMAAGWTLGSLASAGAEGRRVDRVIQISPVLALAGMGALTLLVPTRSPGNWAVLAPICAALAVVGVGVGLAWPHLLTRVVQTARHDEQDLASASLTTVQLFATALGAALAGMVANAAGLVDPGGTAGTARAATWVFGSFAAAPLLGIALAFYVPRTPAVPGSSEERPDILTRP